MAGTSFSTTNASRWPRIHSVTRSIAIPVENSPRRVAPNAFAENFATQRIGNAQTERQQERFIDRVHLDNGIPHHLGWGVDSDGLVGLERRHWRKRIFGRKHDWPQRDRGRAHRSDPERFGRCPAHVAIEGIGIVAGNDALGARHQFHEASGCWRTIADTDGIAVCMSPKPRKITSIPWRKRALWPKICEENASKRS
jgi:hypothetical protein